jgi:hypothetical protein
MRARPSRLAVALCACLVAACSQGPGRSAQSASSTQPQAAGAFQGVYRAEYAGDEQVWNGKPSPGEVSSRQYAIRSACRGEACVATGVRLRDDDATKTFQSDSGQDVAPLTLDRVDGQWLWAEQYPYTCDADGSNGREFVAWAVSPQSDGTLTGTRIDARFASPACTGVFEVPVTLSRVGEVAATTSLPDPTTVPVLRSTAPAGLAGNYRIATTPRQPGAETSTLLAVFRSYCVRNTDTCVALERFTGSSGSAAVNPFEFTGDRWTLSYQGGEVTCPLGGKATRETYVEFVLPSPAATPFDTVAGQQRSTYRGDCTDVNEWNLVAKRVPG